MPFANYKVPQGTLNAKQKEEIIHKTTDETLTLEKMGIKT